MRCCSCSVRVLTGEVRIQSSASALARGATHTTTSKESRVRDAMAAARADLPNMPVLFTFVRTDLTFGSTAETMSPERTPRCLLCRRLIGPGP